MKAKLENIILDDFYKKDHKVNLLCNLIIQYRLQKIENSKDNKMFIRHYHSNFQENLKSPAQIIEWLEMEVETFKEALDTVKNISGVIFLGIDNITIQTSKT
jgi:hypothetical protein